MFATDRDDDFMFETCDEYAARLEAEAEMRADYECALAAAEEAAEEDRKRYPGGRCAHDPNPWSIYGWECKGYDPCPF